MNDLNREIMNVEEYFETYTGGDDYIATWTPKALKDFAEDYHKMKMREENKENKNNDIYDVNNRLLEQKVIDIEDEISRLKEFTGLD